MGSHAARYFSSRGWEAVAFDNLSRTTLLRGREGPIPSNYNWDRLQGVTGVTRVRGDVRRLGEIEGVAADADAVLHTAAQVAVTTSLEDPATDFDVNLRGTFNVLEAARRSSGNPAILFCSTNKVYGSNVNKIPVREDGSRYAYDDPAFKRGIPPDFPIDDCEHTPYGVSKLGADLYVQDYAHTYGLRTVVFRMSCIYGEGQSGNEDQGWVAHFIISILRRTPLTVYGDGKQVRDVLHVEDLVRAFYAALDSGPAIKGRVFNVGGGPENTLSLLELVDLVKTLTGKETSLQFSEWRPGDQKVYVSDVTRAIDALGWRPRISPREGVARLANWYSSEFPT